MSTLVVVDGNDNIRHLAALGSGSEGDPFRPQQVMQVQLSGSFYTGQVHVATAGQIVQLPAYALSSGVLLKALSANNGSIFLGGSDVGAANGYELDKSESILIRIDELSKLYITASANGEGICVIGV